MANETRHTVLVVDDEPHIRASLEDLLEDDFEVLTAANGEQALEMLGERRVAVVLTDQRMPGMAGDQLLGRAAGLCRATRILLTGYADMTALVRAVNRGQIYAYLGKPWNPEELHLTVQRAAEHFELVCSLEEEKELLRLALEAAPDGIAFKDRKGRHLRANRAYAEVVGRELHDIPGRTLEELLDDPVRAAELAELEQRVLTSGRADQDRLERWGVNGSQRWVSTTRVPLPGPQETALLAIHRDVSGRRRAERLRAARLRMSKHRAQLGRLATACLEPAELLGRAVVSLAAGLEADACVFWEGADPLRPVASTGWPGDAPTVDDAAHPLYAWGTGGVAVSPRLDREERFLVPEATRTHFASAAAAPAGRAPNVAAVQVFFEQPHVFEDEEAEFLASAAHLLDLALRRSRAERRHESSEARFRAALESIPDGVVGVDGRGTIVLVNESAEHMFGYARSEMLGAAVAMLLPEAMREQHRAHRENYTGQPRARAMGCGLALSANRSDGSEFPVDISLGPVQTPEGIMVLAVVRDMTDRQKLEGQLFQAQKMEAVGRLAGGVAHDFNNLLTLILGYSDLLMDTTEPDDPAYQDLERIHEAGRKAQRLTHQLLAFSRKQTLAPQVLDLNAMVRELDKMLRRLIGEDVEIRLSLEADLHPIKADPVQVEQILMNLAVNAREAMPQGGRLTIETANVELDQEYARTRPALQPGAYVRLTVSDTGHGMDKGTLEQIFEPFFTTKKSGTGLGLATVYGIVKQSGGDIWVYSEPGRGTTFKLHFPQVEADSGCRRVVVPPAVQARGSGTILLVEDEERVRELAARVLRDQGYKVLEASAADEALFLVDVHQEPIDLLLTDVIMPGLSGADLAKRLDPGLPVLYMSGYTDDALGHHGVVDEDVRLLQKPFTATDLLQRVQQALAVPLGEETLL